MTDILCYICCDAEGDADLNIFETKVNTSGELIYKFVEGFLGLEDDQLFNDKFLQKEKCLACRNCYEKIDEYDLAITQAEIIQMELIRKLDGREFRTQEIQNGMAKSVENVETQSLKSEEFEEYNILKEEETENSSEVEIQAIVVMKDFECFSCELCASQFTTRATYEAHMSSHKENPFECFVCKKKFTQKGALVRHMPIHTGERPHVCEQCGKSFIHHSSYHMHKLAHADVREKKCDVCGLMLRSSSHLARHKRTHSGEKPYSCPVCQQSFAQRYNMTAHLKAHNGISRKSSAIFKCQCCPEYFAKKSQLEKHKKDKHSEYDLS